MTSLQNFLMPLDEVAKALGVSIYTIRRLVAANKFPAVRIGARVMVSSETVLKAQRHGLATQGVSSGPSSAREGAVMTTVGELKKAIANLPDETPITYTHTTDDGEQIHMRVADAWPAHGTFCVEFETKVTEVPSETL
jgi:excisionase family DNA binding protein